MIVLQIWMLVHDVTAFAMFFSTILVILGYPYVVSLMYWVRVMPAMDQACFISTSKSNINVMSVNLLDIDGSDFTPEDYIILCTERVIVPHSKFRYKVVMKHGDMYHQEMSLEETCQKGFVVSSKVLTSRRDLEMFV
jgi:hypothetical protein